jgi:hypothetical protein
MFTKEPGVSCCNHSRNRNKGQQNHAQNKAGNFWLKKKEIKELSKCFEWELRMEH